mmetsp:Transcript_69431/g.159515  ORF Transcript_69431/g.159515 Transcript_69431/m.159515 type:complete len:137 (+) Transcript_69431:215-625(+)
MAMESVAHTIASSAERAFALPGQLEATPALAMLRALRYPPRPSGALGIVSHVDFGDFTLCWSDGEGLQVQGHDGQWDLLAADCWHCMAGGGLQKRTGGLVKAAQHRVVGTDQERFSFCRLHGVSHRQRGGVEVTAS